MAVRPGDQRSPKEQEQVNRFKDLTERILPALAREGGWPIHFDHCFKRICLDAAFHDVWYNHLPRPAEKHLTGAALERAVALAERIAREGVATVRALDADSLRFRGKRPKAH